MVLGVTFLLLISLITSSVLSALGTYFAGLLPGGEVLWQLVNFVVSLVVVAASFTVIFKYVPDATIEWRDVWLGVQLPRSCSQSASMPLACTWAKPPLAPHTVLRARLSP